MLSSEGYYNFEKKIVSNIIDKIKARHRFYSFKTGVESVVITGRNIDNPTGNGAKDFVIIVHLIIIK